MQATLISVGSELTSGQTVNTNAAYLARCLQSLGIACTQHTAVPDEP
ncbi:MAG: competence/damage-inducible protein A, partial [Candidatus Omnitrophica bacterium]|nr:competence/damage-inducible protein A [Candidatus Omnitrophota bacterium]